jgi:hypothetical protein
MRRRRWRWDWDSWSYEYNVVVEVASCWKKGFSVFEGGGREQGVLVSCWEYG